MASLIAKEAEVICLLLDLWLGQHLAFTLLASIAFGFAFALVLKLPLHVLPFLNHQHVIANI